MLIFERDIALDMGTTGVLLYSRGKGVQIREPTIVAVDKFTGRLLKVGHDAQKMLGRTPASIVPIQPITDGVISDYDMTVAMLKELIGRVTSFSLFKPRVLVCVPGSITGVEERAVIDAVVEAGARKVYLVESAVATAYGAGIDVSKPGGSFDDAIIRYVRRRYNVLIGAKTAEEVKINIGCVVPKPEVGIEEVKGRDLVTGLPKMVKLSSTELAEVLLEPAREILESIHYVLERTPPELVADISQNGIVMSGGGSLIYGIDMLVEHDTKLRTVVVDDPISCAAYGAGKMLLRLNELPEGMVNFARKRQLQN